MPPNIAISITIESVPALPMPIFIQDLCDFSFLRYAALAIVLASIACGIVGGYVVAQRQSYMIGAVSHSLLGGVGLARYLQIVHGLDWFSPILGATVAAVAAALAITVFTQKARAREDAVLSAVWTLGVALGVSFIAMTPGYSEDLNSYLFGSVLLISPEDVLVMACQDAVVILVAFLFHNRFLAYCFHPEMLELRGLSPTFTALLLNLLVALTVVLLSQIVGLVLVLVLLVLPAAIAAFWTHRLVPVMLTAGALCLALSMGSLAVSYQFDLPAGATIVEATVALFFLASMAKSALGRLCRDAAKAPASSQR